MGNSFNDNNNRISQLSNSDDKKHNFSDIAGKLEWTGDAVAEQLTIRQEWHSFDKKANRS